MGTPAIGPDEERLRQQARELADEIERHIANHQAVMGEWHHGTCTKCGTEAMLTGLPGSDLCVYCEELRVLTPAGPVVAYEGHPPSRPMLLASLVLAVTGLVMIFADMSWVICAIVLAGAVFFGKAA